MEISTSYYAKAYGIAETATPLPSEDAPAVDAGTYAAIDATTDAYIDETSVGADAASASQLSQEILNWGHESFKNPDLDPQARVHFYEGAMGLFQELHGLGEGQEIPQSIVDSYSLLQADYQNVLQTIQAKTEAKTESQDSLSRIETLSHDLDGLLDDPELTDEVKAQLKNYQKELGKAKSSLELASDPDAVSQLEASFEETLAGAQEAVETAKQAHVEKLAAVQDLMDSLLTSVKDAHCEKHDKLKINRAIAKLKLQMADGSLPLDGVKKQLEDLQGTLKEAVTTQGHRDAFHGLEDQIPSDALPDAVTLAHKISKAMKNGDWDAVNQFLTTMTKDDDMFHYESEIVIEQVIGTLYYGPAGQDKKELKKLLDCIPEKTREKMIDTLKMNPHDWRGFGVDDNREQKLHNKIYGNKKHTIDLLRDSMK